MTPHYVVCAIKDWHVKQFEIYSKNLKGTWTLFTDKSELTFDRLKELNPRYIFFPHWSWLVPKTIVESFECVCFHSSDVPFGRGGSPIQNLIIRGIEKTKISALRMCQELDAGPVYLKYDLSLQGRAQDIFEHSAAIIATMIKDIITDEPSPVDQEGDIVVFKRRNGHENYLPTEGGLKHLYNHIRMLDAESYPASFIEHGHYTIAFTNAVLEDGFLKAIVTIKEKI